MSARNLHRIAGSRFQHIKAPCATCALRRPHGEWEGYCTARAKVLNWREPERQSKRCPDFKSGSDSPGKHKEEMMRTTTDRDRCADLAGELAEQFNRIADCWFLIARSLPNDGGFGEAIGVLNAADALYQELRRRSVEYRTNYGRWPD